MRLQFSVLLVLALVQRWTNLASAADSYNSSKLRGVRELSATNSTRRKLWNDHSCGGVWIFKDADFKGQSQHIGCGASLTSSQIQIGNDELSSFDLSPHAKLTLYLHDNFMSKKLVYFGPRRLNLVPRESWNDAISSLRVEEHKIYGVVNVVGDPQFGMHAAAGKASGGRMIYWVGSTEDQNKESNRVEARRLVRRVHERNNHRRVDHRNFVVGDMTNDAKLDQLEDYKKIFLDRDWLPSRGNHDDQNNFVWDKFSRTWKTHKHVYDVAKKHNVFDLDSESFNLGTRMKGTAAYSFNVNGKKFINLGSAFKTSGGLNQGNPTFFNIGGNLGNWVPALNYGKDQVTSIEPFLMRRLLETSEPMVIFTHSCGAFSDYLKLRPNVRHALHRSTVSAIVCGHAHPFYLKHSDVDTKNSKDVQGRRIPLIYAGASMYRNYLEILITDNAFTFSMEDVHSEGKYVEEYSEKVITVPFKTKEGAHCNKDTCFQPTRCKIMYIVHKKTKKCIEHTNNGGGQINMGDCGEGKEPNFDQKFLACPVEKTQDGYEWYNIRPMGDNMACIDKRNDNEDIHQHTCHGGDNQKWMYDFYPWGKYNSDDRYELMFTSKGSSKIFNNDYGVRCMDGNGQHVYHKPCQKDNEYQKWEVKLISFTYMS